MHPLIHPLQALDFGCVLMDTLRRATLTLTNPGKAAVEYSWAWLRQDALAPSPAAANLDGPEPSSAALGGAATPSVGARGPLTALGSARFAGSVAASSVAALPGALFDLLPIRGRLAPGESESVEVSFYGLPGVKATALAACRVVDGPEYQVGPVLLYGVFGSAACIVGSLLSQDRLC
jgi:hydrocephalus-inducing protein